VLDPTTRTALIGARVPKWDKRLKPGLWGLVSVLSAARAGALTVPSEAVFFEGSQALVFVVKADGTVARTPITLGTRLPDNVEVTGGLSAGQRIVRAGHQKLFEGAKVVAVDAASGASGATGATGP
jgi:membrane fusion protein (multidrug efflux system)